MNKRRLVCWMRRTTPYLVFKNWVVKAADECINACGMTPDSFPIEQWESYYDQGLSPTEAGSIVARLIS